jgi:hypothetical protein
MKSVIENFINGNLTDAKKGAENYSDLSLANFMIDHYGYEPSKARMVAYYLKEQCGVTFQMACDAI